MAVNLQQVQRAMVEIVLGRYGRNYMLIVRNDGSCGNKFMQLKRECCELRKIGIIHANTRHTIWKLPQQCVCLLCNIIGSNLIIPMCGDVVDLMNRDNAVRACEFARSMNGFTIHVKKTLYIQPINAHGYPVYINLSNTEPKNDKDISVAIPSGTYDIESIIAIMAGIRRVNHDVFDIFAREHNIEYMTNLARAACMRVWDCDYVVNLTQESACATTDSRVAPTPVLNA
jgi:hypothetical protein